MATRTKTCSAVASDPPTVAGVRITHPDRLVFPQAGITKGELAAYYASVADWILPHIAGRPLSLVRCPEGADQKCFFQKHPSVGLPASVKRIPIREKDGVEEYLVVEDAEGLVTLIQFGAIEIHPWGSRASDVETPDRLIFDLDPDPTLDWSEVKRAALFLREVFTQLEWTSFVKTTGGKGLHVVLPIKPELQWPPIKAFCKSIAEWLVKTAPERFTSNPLKATRHGRIFIDYLRNDRGATSVAPYAVRARPGAAVSLPLTWDELRRVRGPASFTLENVPRRLAGRMRDPWHDFGDVRQSITCELRQQLRQLFERERSRSFSPRTKASN